MLYPFHPGGTKIISAYSDRSACLWDLKGNILKELKGHTGYTISVVFSPDGSKILTGSADKTAHLWDANGNTMKELTGHSFWVNSVAFSPD